MDLKSGCTGYNYLEFHARKRADSDTGKTAGPDGVRVLVYDESGSVVAQFEAGNDDLDEDEHQYVMDLSAVTGVVSVEFEGEGEISEVWAY